MEEKFTRLPKQICIPINIYISHDFSWPEKILITEIDSLSNLGECYASNEHFAEHLQVSKDRASKMISSLVKRGYINIELVYKKGTKQVEKRILSINKLGNPYLWGIVESNHRGIVESNHRGIVESNHRGIGENTDRGIGENTDRGIGENTDRGIGENTDRGIGENTDRGIGENTEENNTLYFNNTKDNKDIVSSDNKKPVKHKYGQFNNVLLSDVELEKLNAIYDGVTSKIEDLSLYIESKNAKYKSHYATLISWLNKDGKKKKTAIPEMKVPQVNDRFINLTESEKQDLIARCIINIEKQSVDYGMIEDSDAEVISKIKE
ncbi:MAG: helix-turn-helix domain-containing protein [Lachnospiraceae bacterium]|nr:helix-turn-helix domain-containing protein [Lachnospiraceae bacterium]